MSRSVAGRLLAPLRGSIRSQILAVLLGMLFLGSVVQGLVFYLQARSVSIQQMSDSYRGLALQVAGLSAYNMQFNKAGLKETVTDMVTTDQNLLWVEYTDASGKVLQAGGPLKEAPYTHANETANVAKVSQISTPTGPALLVRAPINAAVAAAGGGFGDLGAEPQAAAPQSKTIGELRIVVSLKPLAVLLRSYATSGTLTILFTMIVGTVASVVIMRYLTRPLVQLSQLAARIASGDLSSSGMKGAAAREDELGRLVTSFQGMSQNLAGMIREIREAFQRVEEGTQTVRKNLAITLNNSKEHEGVAQRVTDQVSAIQKAVGEVTHLMEGLSRLAEEVSSSVLEMIASIDQIASHTDSLTESVNTVASTLTQNVAAIREIDSSAENLNRFVEETSSSMAEMEASIRQIEENAAATRKATEQVAEEAESGTRAMEHASDSIQRLQATFESTHEVMRLLGQRSEEVGNILSVIDEVMEQTHLLALNAAIIAAQAGEHGKSFSVVAGEIKELAGKTSVSTREIAALIDAVQRDVHQAVEAVGAQRAIVDQTVTVSQETRQVFGRIQGAVKPSLRMVQEIARNTTEQARGAAGILRATQQLSDLAHHLRRGTKEQTLGSEQILEAMGRIRLLAEEMKRATDEQSEGSSLIRQAMDRLTAAVADVMAQTQAQGKAGREVERTMEAFRTSNRASVSSVQEASEQVEALAQRAEEVGRGMGRFHTEGS
jgi:methyl-accepting chemotaxis protein